MFHFIVLCLQILLIGLSAYRIALGTSPMIVGIYASCIAINLLFGFMNIKILFGQ